MPARLIDIFVPNDAEQRVAVSLEEHPLMGVWSEKQSEGMTHVQVLVVTGEAEAVLDDLERHLAGVRDFRIILLPVLAALPRAGEKEGHEEVIPSEGEQSPQKTPLRVSRTELYAQISKTIELSTVYSVLVILSAVVASVGLMRGNVAVIIAAMVIAPMLGPNMALALAATLADFDLAKKASKAGALGVLLALVFSLLVGAVLGVDPQAPEIAGRTQVAISDVALALASGAAGALAFTSSAATWLIGVMVAVSLLPPLVACGMLLGGGYYGDAGAAFLLFMTNIICVNLVAVATFVMQGIRPRSWWEASKARRATKWALIIWSVMLVLLVIVILLSEKAS